VPPTELEEPRTRHLRTLLRSWLAAAAQARRRRSVGDVAYDVDGLQAHRIGLGGGSFFQVELYDGYFATAWSTRLTIGDVLDRLPFVVPPSETAIVFDEHAGKHVEHPTGWVTEEIRGGRSYPFVRLELPHATITWDRPVLEATRPLGLTRAPRRVGLIADVFDHSGTLELLRRTGTAPVARYADRLLARAEYVHEHVPHGRLGSWEAA
jgi:hypothetical protein